MRKKKGTLLAYRKQGGFITEIQYGEHGALFIEKVECRTVSVLHYGWYQDGGYRPSVRYDVSRTAMMCHHRWLETGYNWTPKPVAFAREHCEDVELSIATGDGYFDLQNRKVSGWWLSVKEATLERNSFRSSRFERDYFKRNYPRGNCHNCGFDLQEHFQKIRQDGGYVYRLEEGSSTFLFDWEAHDRPRVMNTLLP